MLESLQKQLTQEYVMRYEISIVKLPQYTILPLEINPLLHCSPTYYPLPVFTSLN